MLNSRHCRCQSHLRNLSCEFAAHTMAAQRAAATCLMRARQIQLKIYESISTTVLLFLHRAPNLCLPMNHATPITIAQARVAPAASLLPAAQRSVGAMRLTIHGQVVDSTSTTVEHVPWLEEEDTKLIDLVLGPLRDGNSVYRCNGGSIKWCELVHQLPFPRTTQQARCRWQRLKSLRSTSQSLKPHTDSALTGPVQPKRIVDAMPTQGFVAEPLAMPTSCGAGVQMSSTASGHGNKRRLVTDATLVHSKSAVGATTAPGSADAVPMSSLFAQDASLSRWSSTAQEGCKERNIVVVRPFSLDASSILMDIALGCGDPLELCDVCGKRQCRIHENE